MEGQKIISNYHTHTVLCRHAKGSVEDVCQYALSKGYEIIGVSDHAPWPNSLTDIIVSRRMSFEQYQNIYLPALKDVKERLFGKIAVLSALEIEFLDELRIHLPKLSTDLDYLILGQHYIKLRDGKIVDVYNSINKSRMEIYAQTVCEALSTNYFAILAHPEIYAYSAMHWDNACEEVAKQIINAAYQHKVALEINANGIRKNLKVAPSEEGESYLYPRRPFWKLVSDFQKEHPDLKVVVNDDSHDYTAQGDEATKKAYQFASDLGIKTTPYITLKKN